MKKSLKIMLALLFVGAFSISAVDACSRVTYTTKSGEVVTGRNMDWLEPDNAQIRVFKRGELKKSVTKSNPIQWTSKYGGIGVFSGTPKGHFANSMLNEKGLSADVLWLDEANYGKYKNDETTIGVTEQLQYFVDNFATVNEVVDYVQNQKNRVEPSVNDFFSGFPLTLHYIVTDKTGDNAIIEYVNGEPNVYRKKGRIVMTNSPTYDKMTAIDKYFKEAGGLNMPGSSLSQARFVYLSAWLDEFTDTKLPRYINGIKNKDMSTQAVLSVLSLMRGVSTPVGVVPSLEAPNNTSTIWRTVCDIKNNKFYFDSALSFSTVWFDLNKVDFTKNQVLKIDVGDSIYGDVTDKLQEIK